MAGGRGAIIQGRRLIEGRLLFEEIRYMNVIVCNCELVFQIFFQMCVMHGDGNWNVIKRPLKP